MATHRGLPDFDREKEALKRTFEELPDVIGQIAVDHAQGNFDHQGFKDGGKIDKWKARKKKKKDVGRSILVKSSQLKGSIDFDTNNMEIGVFADASSDGFEYGAVHNSGDDENGIPQRKFIDNSKDIEEAVDKHLDDEMDRIFG